MLKKVLGIALLMASLSVTAFAAIPKDSMHIGGLKPGMTIEQVAAMYAARDVLYCWWCYKGMVSK